MTPEFLIAHAPDEAIPRIAADLLHDPDDVGALCQMARAQLAADRPDEALPAAERAVRFAPGQSHPLSVLSAVLSRLGRHEEAIEAARASVRAEPRNPYRHDRATWALLAAGGRLREAEQSALTALTIESDEAALWFSYALVLAQTHRKSEARRALLHVLSIEPEHPAARQELADLGSSRGWSPEALARGPEGYADAPRTDPAGQEVTTSLRNFLHLTAVLLAVLSVAGFRFAQNDAPAAARWTAVFAVLIPVALAGWFITRRGLPTRRTVNGTGQLPALVLAGVSAVAVVAAVAGPDAWLGWLLGGAAVGGVLVRVATVSPARERVELPYVLGRIALTLTLIACLVLSVVCLFAARATGQPALDVTAVLFALGAFVIGRMIVKRGRIADSA